MTVASRTGTPAGPWPGDPTGVELGAIVGGADGVELGGALAEGEVLGWDRVELELGAGVTGVGEAQAAATTARIIIPSADRCLMTPPLTGPAVVRLRDGPLT